MLFCMQHMQHTSNQQANKQDIMIGENNNTLAAEESAVINHFTGMGKKEIVDDSNSFPVVEVDQAGRLSDASTADLTTDISFEELPRTSLETDEKEKLQLIDSTKHGSHQSEVSFSDQTALTKTTVDEEKSQQNAEKQEDIKNGPQGKKVSFSTLEMREYPICIGDSPAVMAGVPLSIDWIHQSALQCSVEDYEKSRPYKRNMMELHMPSSFREGMLKQQGYSKKEIMEAVKNANIGRSRRKNTNNTPVNLAFLEEILQRNYRAIMNATVRRGAKNRERRLLSMYQTTSKD
jgi:hypothetical protein